MRQILLLALACGSTAWSGGPAAWESNSYADFLKGRFTSLSLTRDGRLVLAPKLDTVFSSDQAAIWSVAVAPDGVIYAGTGHRGRVYKIDRAGAATVLWTAPQLEVFAVALDPQGRLWAATSPNGRIYRIEKDQGIEVYDPKERYVWSLAFSADGTLYAGTGEGGRIHRIERDGKGSIWYETGQSHVTSLKVDTQGRLLAGSEPNGLLYRIEAKDKGFVLYDSSLPEIRAIATAPDGTIYAAALGGSLTQKTAQAAAAAAAQPAAGTPVTTITVTADAQTGIDLKPKPEAPKPPEQPQQPVAQPVVDMAGVEKSAIYKISPDNSVETLWSSKEENVFDLVTAGGELTFATDVRGRIYKLAQDLKATLLVETRDGDTVRLAETPQGLLAGTSNVAKLYRLAASMAATGSYESAVHDAGTVARWGRVEWRGDFPAGARLEFRTRSGNSQRPDKTWSDWSPPITAMAQSQIASPNARFIQWKVEMSGAGSALDSVAVSYLPQNNRPVVRSVSVTPLWAATAAAKSTAAAAQTPASYSITVTDTGDAASPTSAGNPTLTLTRQGAQQLLISWQADDPDGDRLVYTLSVRGEDEREWKRVKDQFTENTYTLEADLLADGRYLFRVEASDRLSNPPNLAKTSELISPPVFVDNSPPRVALTLRGNTLEADAEDTGSPLRRAEYSIDAGPWTLVEAADGISDSLHEKYVITLPAMAAGEHVVVVRVYDSSGNAGLAKRILR
jgi:hypothetical protein